MTALTPANVAPGAKARLKRGTAGVAIGEGDSVYKDTVTNTIKLADADALATAQCKGIACHDADVGQPITYQDGGPMTIAASGVGVGVWYYVGTTPGDLVPFADLGQGDFASSVCKGISATDVDVLIHNAESAIP